MQFAHELLVAALIVVGASFALVGSFGMVKLPDLMSRLHAPTKATTLGVGGALMASMTYFLILRGTLSIHELLISLFLFLTAPITAHFLAKAHMHTLQEPYRELPRPGQTGHWSTFANSPETAAEAPARHAAARIEPPSPAASPRTAATSQVDDHASAPAAASQPPTASGGAT
ncbi:MAG: Na+/H+ antiporter subunit G [Azovibrio sp.]|nr:Na+/H+ antiporter subunit G [Azovibrio sp.]